MPVLLVLGRQEHQDLKANLGYVDTGLKKGGKNGELSQFLTATPNSAEYHNNLFQLPTQSITKL